VFSSFTGTTPPPPPLSARALSLTRQAFFFHGCFWHGPERTFGVLDLSIFGACFSHALSDPLVAYIFFFVACVQQGEHLPFSPSIPLVCSLHVLCPSFFVSCWYFWRNKDPLARTPPSPPCPFSQRPHHTLLAAAPVFPLSIRFRRPPRSCRRSFLGGPAPSLKCRVK